jgi:hypothetical protein
MFCFKTTWVKNERKSKTQNQKVENIMEALLPSRLGWRANVNMPEQLDWVLEPRVVQGQKFVKASFSTVSTWK